MTKKTKASGRKAAKKGLRKTKQRLRQEKPPVRTVKPSKAGSRATGTLIAAESAVVTPETAKEGTGFKIIINRIEGETTIGDLIVVFPRTREVLKKHGLNLDVEDAGDIYMSLEAFAALRGLEMKPLLLELETVSKQPSAQPATPVILTSPTP